MPESIRWVGVDRADRLPEDVVGRLHALEAEIRPLSRSATLGAYQGVQTAMIPPTPIPLPVLLEQAVEGNGLVVMAERIQDPQNLGAIFRVSAALGALGVVISKHRAASITAAVVRASAGAALWMQHAEVSSSGNTVALAADAGLRTVVLDGKAEQTIFDVDWRGPLLLAVGSERKGASELLQVRAQNLARIPMAANSVESLNVSTALACALTEAVRARSVA